ncbi:MAG: FAD-binding oxidoreductase [Lysobacterales bacterium]|jgi:gamma-glutamylputrescine oxidase|nr:MAG: FAD-binding oxidoreductase [Xanthomonadales bacterium]
MNQAKDYYRATAPSLGLPTLRGELATKVAVIGGGYAGLCTALGLMERGIAEVTVLEAKEIGFGASGRNGGFVFAGYSRPESRLLKELPREHARRLFRYTLDAVETVRQRIRRYRIACEAIEAGVLWADWFPGAPLARARQRLLAEGFGLDWPLISQEALAREHLRTPRYFGALLEPNGFHVHPLKLAQGYAQALRAGGVAIYERSPVLELSCRGREYLLTTPEGRVQAEHVVLALGGYSRPLLARAHRALLPIATYVMCTQPDPIIAQAIPTAAAVYDTRFAFDYYRRLPDGRLLWGGRISILDRSPETVAALLRRDLRRVFPELAELPIEYAWSGLMGYGRSQMPHIGAVAPRLWLNQGYGGHGVATTTVGGELIAAAIAEGDERWRDFEAYAPRPAYGVLGLIAAELRYLWLQFRDWLRERAMREPA